jgi:predicted esterase
MLDQMIPFENSKAQVTRVRQAGLQVEWTEIIKGHTIDPYGEMMLIRKRIEQSFA